MCAMKKITRKHRAIYPGSFDPVTFGHIDLVKRALSLFDEVYVVVSRNPEKTPLFSTEERLGLVQKAVGRLPGVKVQSFDGLTVHYAKQVQARSIIRGLRATSDFDYEFQMALTNRQLSREVDTIFLMPSETHFYLSSKLIKEIAERGGDVSAYVPSYVAERLRKKLGCAN